MASLILFRDSHWSLFSFNVWKLNALNCIEGALVVYFKLKTEYSGMETEYSINGI